MWKKFREFDKEIIKHIGLIAQLGLIMISSILILFFLGLYLDKLLHAGGVLAIVGIVLGVFTGGFT
ncbi:MAG: AtpZ/AtpI family protein, partial [Candidatus Cloacimonadota bacterium]|nr:AtpZ/AtpI family protein [Candidatus Cloacimonadota bacterium]